MFLDEHVWAPMMMSVTLIVALLGVIALGAYVVYCDIKNRAGERDVALVHEAEVGKTDHHHPIVAEPVGQDVETSAAPPVTARSISRRRRAEPPPEV
ncbi:MAG: hypothetical protein M3Z13_02430 [Candidatus Dormibacteraeota bacterium]|nr:hypothetical protein [Candidatus Dormibacteraeota bacterium]